MSARVLVIALSVTGLAAATSAAALPLPAPGHGPLAEEPCGARADRSLSLCYEAPAIEVRARRSPVLSWTAPTIEVHARRAAPPVLTWAAPRTEITAHRAEPVARSGSAPTITVHAAAHQVARPRRAALHETEAPESQEGTAAALAHLAEDSLDFAAGEAVKTVERLAASLADLI